jgi:hypothetical protein
MRSFCDFVAARTIRTLIRCDSNGCVKNLWATTYREKGGRVEAEQRSLRTQDPQPLERDTGHITAPGWEFGVRLHEIELYCDG